MDYIIIISVFLVIGIAFILVRRKIEKDKKYISSNDFIWSKLENNLLLRCDVHRVSYDKPMLQKDDGNKALADSRCYQAYLYYKNNGTLNTTFHHSLWSLKQFKTLRKYGLDVVRENIARGYKPENVMKKWIESPSHFKNLTGDYKYTGISAQQFEGVWYYAQIFSK